MEVYIPLIEVYAPLWKYTLPYRSVHRLMEVYTPL